jgi:uncharacterized protein
MSELTDAIQQGDAARVAALLDETPALLQSTENGVTPILLALYHGKTDVARLIADRGVALSFGEACALGDLATVKTMLADRSLLEARTADGFPPLGLSIFFRNPAVARYLIEQGADVNAAAENPMRVAPVHAAAATCDHETMRLLLDRGADPNARQQMDYTPLHGAASRGDVEMAKLLLAHGADREPRGTDGQTPADVARSHGHPEWELSALS